MLIYKLVLVRTYVEFPKLAVDIQFLSQGSSAKIYTRPQV